MKSLTKKETNEEMSHSFFIQVMKHKKEWKSTPWWKFKAKKEARLNYESALDLALRYQKKF